jgi:hemolysin activation/secretion protein
MLFTLCIPHVKCVHRTHCGYIAGVRVLSTFQRARKQNPFPQRGARVYMFHNRFASTGLVIIFSATASVSAVTAAHAEEPRVLVADANGGRFTTVAAQVPAAGILSTAVILGSTAYTPAELFSTYSAHLGQPINRASAQSIVNALTALYERDGYSQPELHVDDRLTARGILHVNVYEPRITQITVGGDPGPYREQLESLAAPLRNSQPVRRIQVQQTLQSMRDLPGLTITAATRRDEANRNAYVLAVDTKYQPVEGRVSTSNRGTGEVGPNFLMSHIAANGVLGFDEKLGALFAAAQDFDEYHGFGLYADAPIGSSGTRAFVMGFQSTSNPTESPDDYDDEYSRERLTLRATRPFQRASGISGSIGATLELEDLGIERSGELLREDRLRSFEVGGKLSWRGGSRTQYLATLDVRKGLDALGAELYAPDLTNDPRDIAFLVTRAQLIRVTRFNEKWSLRFDALAQLSNDVLPYSERFKIGGERIGRGFEVTEVAGDRGVGGKVELRRELTSTARIVGRTAVYGFYDFGATWTRDEPRTNESATTGGIGLALNGARLSGYLELAKPFTHEDVEGNKDPTVFFELGYRF